MKEMRTDLQHMTIDELKELKREAWLIATNSHEDFARRQGAHDTWQLIIPILAQREGEPELKPTTNEKGN